MAITKTELFNDKQKRTASLAKALGHPARIAILEILASHPGCICGDITDQLPLAQSTVSQHLKALKKAGIIQGEIDGVRTCYCLDKQVVPELKILLTELTDQLTESINNECC